MRVRRIVSALAALLLVFGMAGCNATNGSSAGAKTTLTAANLAPRLIAAQAKAGSVHVDGTITGGGTAGQVSLAGDVRLAGGHTAAHFTMSLAGVGEGIEAIVLNSVMYLKLPMLSSSKPWLKTDLNSGPMAVMRSLNTTSMLNGLKGALALKPLGQETVNGVSATHYTVTVNAAKALKAQGIPSSSVGGTVPKQLSYDLWVSSDDLVRKISMSLSSFSVNLNFSHYGKPVTVTAPPASQVTQHSAFAS
jgi:LppX/LprAFG-like lipoprotein